MTLAGSGKCRFIGNVAVGEDVSLSELQPFYHAVVMVSTIGMTSEVVM